MWTSINFEGKIEKKETGNICEGTQDNEFEQDWSVDLGTMLCDRQKIKNYISNFKDFFGKSQ